LTKDTRQGRGKDQGPEAVLWELVGRDFPSATDRQQMQWEREDGIWNGDWKPGDSTDLAGRYATATRNRAGSHKEKDAKATGLPAARALYHRSRRIEEAVQVAKDLDLEPLRLAINDLMQTFGKRYPNGQHYLDRLARLEELRNDIMAEAGGDPDALVRVTDAFTSLRGDALLANPLLDFEKLLLIKRRGNLGLPQNWQGNCVMRGGFDNEIAVLSSLKPGSTMSTLYRPESNSFVGDVDLHWDAGRMLFSMKAGNNRYEIFEINADGTGLRQVTPSEPDVDNYDACYLPSEKIIYDSTACLQGVPCVGGGNQVANLHVINPDGTGIRRLCFDQDHDWCPSVMNDGRVIFTRWEYSDTPHYFTRVVMVMNPDGTNQRSLYGSNSYWPNSTFYPRSIPNHPSQFVGIISGHHGVPRMGELIIFDPSKGQHEADGVVQRIPGFGETVEPIIRDQLVNNSWPRFLHPYPLSDKYHLAACQPDANSPWGIYLVDVFDNMLPIAVEPGVALLEPVPLRKTKRPPVIPSRTTPGQKDAIVYLADIYKGGGLKDVPPGTAKKLRLFAFDYGYHNLANHTYVGIEGPWDIHRILGTVDIEKDGSSAFRIPANTPIAVQPLDEDGKALQLMRSWLVAMPGESLSCTGCHEQGNETPPNQPPLAMTKAPQDIRPWFGPARGFSFDREVQPVLDRHCIGCHNDEPHNGHQLSDLRQDQVREFSRAYKELQKYVRRPGPESDYHMFPPAEYHADTSPLIQMLDKGHHGVKLDQEAMERLYTWIDLNVPYYGTWGEFRDIPRGQRERRAELRKLHAGIDEDYEVIPELPAKPTTPIIPKPPKPPKLADVDCPEWPFDDKVARERQGQDCNRLISLDAEEEKTLPLSMVRVPAGEFVMGDAAGAADEGPPSRVKIDQPFWITRNLVTNAQFALFDPAHDSRYLDRRGKDHSNRGNPLNKPEQPVVRVSWDRAMAFCDWLSRQTGRRYALPTEAQWEFACRAGAPADQAGNGRAWGLDRMPGDTAEWTRSTYKSYPYAPNDGRNNGARQGRKVVRGATAISLPNDCRDTYRLSYQHWQGVWNVGFRVVCLDEEPELAAATSAR
jgi:formylglycine-generating enzyme required for sulfatase activity